MLGATARSIVGRAKGSTHICFGVNVSSCLSRKQHRVRAKNSNRKTDVARDDAITLRRKERGKGGRWEGVNEISTGIAGETVKRLESAVEPPLAKDPRRSMTSSVHR